MYTNWAFITEADLLIAADSVECLLEIIKKQLEQGDDVLISGGGKFCVKEKDARKGRKPAIGEDLILRKQRIVTFKCSGKQRKRINGQK